MWLNYVTNSRFLKIKIKIKIKRTTCMYFKKCHFITKQLVVLDPDLLPLSTPLWTNNVDFSLEGRQSWRATLLLSKSQRRL